MKKKKKDSTVVWGVRSTKQLKKDLSTIAKENGMTRNEYIVLHLSMLAQNWRDKQNGNKKG